MAPLAGLTVVSIEQAVAAPLASRHLADLGARVIKIERPGTGDFARHYDDTVSGMSSHFVWLNRSKESLTLDLKHEAGRDVLARLLAGADVLLCNLAPGALARLGFSRAALRQTYPHLVACEISGYGSDGPFRNRKAYDLLVQSEVGLLSITGTGDSPAKVGISIADIAAGMYAFAGILGALLERAATGTGTFLEISLFDALAEWMGYPSYYTAYGGRQPARSGAHHASIAPYGPYQAEDGRTVYLAVQNEREWKRFCAGVLRQPHLAADPRFCANTDRVHHRAALDAVIHAVFGRLPADEVAARLEDHEIAHARMNDIEEFLRHPQLSARNRWTTVQSPVGPLRTLRSPLACAGNEAGFGPIPDLGQHTVGILQELGFTPAAIEAWRAEGVI